MTEKEQEKLVYQDGQCVYLYDEIDRESALGVKLAINAAIEYTNTFYPMNLGLTPNKGEPIPIYLFIHSYGGFTDASFSLVDYMNNVNHPIYTIGEGSICSGATLLLTSGSKRLMTPNATLLLHSLRGVQIGTIDTVKDHMKNWDMSHEKMIAHYVENTNLSKKDVKKLLKRESWLSASECLEYGIIDAIYDLRPS